VSKVLPDSPAAGAGFKAGDVIVKFNNRIIDTSAALPPLVGTAPVGRDTPVEVIREGNRKKLKVRIGELPSDDDLQIARAPGTAKKSNRRLNASVRNLTESEREAAELSGGVMIDKVESGPAYDAGLRAGDIILQINSEPVDSTKALTKIVDELKAGSSVPVLIQRQGGPLFMAMKISADE